MCIKTQLKYEDSGEAKNDSVWTGAKALFLYIKHFYIFKMNNLTMICRSQMNVRFKTGAMEVLSW